MCGESMPWRDEDKLFICACGWFVDEADAKEFGLAADDGWIRSPEDVLPRLLECNHRAAINPYLNDFDLLVYDLYVEVAAQHKSVQIMAADRWVAAELGIKNHQRVAHARKRLESFNHLKRLQPTEVTMYALQKNLAERRARGMRAPVVLEVRRGPSEWPGCAECGGPIPDIHRVSKKYCGSVCRTRAFRREGTLAAAEEIKAVSKEAIERKRAEREAREAKR